MSTVTELHFRDRGFFQSMAHQLMKNQHLADLKGQMKDAVAGLVERAKAEGDLRQDISPEDVFAFCCAAAQAGTMAPSASSRAWKRYLAVITDGMRAT